MTSSNSGAYQVVEIPLLEERLGGVDISPIVTGSLYYASGAGVFEQSQIDQANSNPTLVSDEAWERGFMTTVDALELRVKELFPKARVSLEVGDSCTTPWVVVVNYGLQASELNDESVYLKHREVLSLFTSMVAREHVRMVSLHRDFAVA